MDKRWAYEESMRMPFLVRYPKSITAGSTSDAIIENVDFAPTMLDFAGRSTPEYMQGMSFRKILETSKEPADWKDAAYYHYWMHMAHHFNPAHIAVRTKQFKLIMFYGAYPDKNKPETPPGWELYDLNNDPAEMNNLYDNPEYKGIIKELKIKLKELRKKYKEDDPKLPFNKVIEEYWEYSDADREKAIQISHEYLKSQTDIQKK